MEHSSVQKEDLREILTRLRHRGFDQKGVSIRIGYDEKGMTLANALRGSSQTKVNEAYFLITSQFADELNMDAPSVKIGEVVNLQTINSKLDRILNILEKSK